MAKADFHLLEERITELAGRSPVGAKLESVSIEADKNDDAGDFLRVLLAMKNFDGVSDGDLEKLIVDIENLVENFDERFPSVRFSDAA